MEEEWITVYEKDNRRKGKKLLIGFGMQRKNRNGKGEKCDER